MSLLIETENGTVEMSFEEIEQKRFDAAEVGDENGYRKWDNLAEQWSTIFVAVAA